MKRIAVISVTLVAFVAASFATAATGAFWTTSKAERIVSRDMLLRLSPSDRAALEQELTRGVALFGGLQVVALDEGNAEAAARYEILVSRYSSALRKLRTGLAIEQARCAGAGSTRQNRFARFHCEARSETLIVPSPTLQPAPVGELPSIAEDASRFIGPFQAQISVRVTGTRTMASRLLLVRVATPDGAGDLR